MSQADTRSFLFGCSTVSARLLWQAEFAPGAQWLFEAQGGTLEFADGRATIDCVGKRGATLWVRRQFPSDIVMEFAGTCVPPSAGHNLNSFLAAGYADGRAIDAVTRTGWYAEYHQFPNYIVTLTNSHTRVRRDPGFVELSELMLGSQIDHRYLVRIAKTGGRIRVNIDGRLIHDVTDPDPLGPGWLALRTWETKIIYDHWAVYEIAEG